MERKKEALIALPPVQATPSSEKHCHDKPISPLTKWQIQRYSTPNSLYCQEELVNYWLHRNHIRVVQKLPKIDPTVLTNRGTDVSKYFTFIQPAPFGLKVFSRDTTQRKALMAPPEYSSLCPRLLRSQQRSQTKTIPRDPVIRVGGGYRRLSWKVLDVLPSIGVYNSDFPPFSCNFCHANLPVVEKVISSRGRLRTILAAPKRCHRCGTSTKDNQTIREGDLHESVLDTIHRGDSRFIVDHRRFDNPTDRRSARKTVDFELSSSPMDWRDDLESFRLHMSRQSQHDDVMGTSDQASDQIRPESEKSVFITEPEANVDDVNKPPDVRCAWDDGVEQVDNGIGRDDLIKGLKTGSFSSDNDNDCFSDFEIIEDYDPKSGFSVRLRRKPFGGNQKTSYFIHGIQTDDGKGENSKATGRELSHRYDNKNLRQTQTNSPTRSAERKTSPGKNQKRQNSPIKNGNKEGLKHERQKGSKTAFQAKASKPPLNLSESSYTVALDRRDFVFVEEPIMRETDDDDDDVILYPKTRLSEEPLSDDESWRQDLLISSTDPRATISSLAYQDITEGTSSFSGSPTQHDGYLADSEENADLTSLQAQIEQARNEAKRHHRRKKEQPQWRKEAEERKEIAKEVSSQGSPPEKSTDIPVVSAPVTNTQWDSDWESDFSLHVQPLSDLSALSSGDEQLENGPQQTVSRPNDHPLTRKGTEKRTTDSLRTDESTRSQELSVSMINSEAAGEGTDKETNVEEKKVTRKIVVKPIPFIDLGSDAEDTVPRPRPRPVRDEGELSDSDLNFYKQQLQAPRGRKSMEKGETDYGPVVCKGIDCYRCGAAIPECEGVCPKCGTWCQRQGGPCNACRDVCESCGKPKYRCSSVGENPEESEDDKEIEDLDDSNAEDNGAVIELTEGTEQEREESLVKESGEILESVQNVQRKKERKSRAPHDKKKKDLNNIKRVRVRTKREDTARNEEGEHELDVNSMEDTRQQTEEPVLHVSFDEEEPIQPSILAPSAFPLKSTRTTKPSKRVISQTVVYKEKRKAPKAERTSPIEEEIEAAQKEESLVTSPEQVLDVVAPSEELPLTSRDGPGGEVIKIEKNLDEEKVLVENRMNGSENAKSEEVERADNKKNEEMKIEKEEQQQNEGDKKKIIPKIRGVARVNAAFRERAELAKRLKRILSEAIGEVIGQADIKTRKDSNIDYLAQYRLVDRSHLEMYGRAFTLEDEDEDGIISYEQMLVAFEGVPSIAGMSRKQLMFVLKVLELLPGSRITFKMFSVTTALCEKVSVLDEFLKRLVEDLDLFELECKLDFYRKMFFITGDFSVNYITADQLRIELKAGGLNKRQEDHVIQHIMQSTQTGEISFLDYMAYLPLFLSMHKNICDNALDMSSDKYQSNQTT